MPNTQICTKQYMLPKNVLQQHPEVRFRYCMHICKIYYKNIQIYYAIH